MGALDDGAARAIRVGAVLGQRFDTELLRAALGAPIEAVAHALRAGVQAQLVTADRSAPTAFEFRHARSWMRQNPSGSRSATTCCRCWRPREPSMRRSPPGSGCVRRRSRNSGRTSTYGTVPTDQRHRVAVADDAVVADPVHPGPRCDPDPMIGARRRTPALRSMEGDEDACGTRPHGGGRSGGLSCHVPSGLRVRVQPPSCTRWWWSSQPGHMRSRSVRPPSVQTST